MLLRVHIGDEHFFTFATLAGRHHQCAGVTPAWALILPLQLPIYNLFCSLLSFGSEQVHNIDIVITSATVVSHVLTPTNWCELSASSGPPRTSASFIHATGTVTDVL